MNNEVSTGFSVGHTAVSSAVKQVVTNIMDIYEDVDFADVIIENSATFGVDNINAAEAGKALVEWLKNGTIAGNNAGDFVIDKGINAAFWAATKGFVENYASSTGGLSVSTADAVYKPVLALLACILTGKEFSIGDAFATGVSGYVKKAAGDLLNSADVFEATFGLPNSIKFPNLTSKTIKELLMKTNPAEFLSSYSKFSMVSSHMNLINATIGVDYIASLAANIAKAIAVDGTVEFKDLKAGSSLLKSTTKMICSYAGQLIGFTLGGNVGADTGKIVGTTVGAFVGEMQVTAFADSKGSIDEGWCARAGAAEIAGAALGAAAVIFLANPATLLPIAVGMLVGAAVCYVGTVVAYHCEPVKNAIESAEKNVGDFFLDVGTFINSCGSFVAGEFVPNGASYGLSY